MRRGIHIVFMGMLAIGWAGCGNDSNTTLDSGNRTTDESQRPTYAPASPLGQGGTKGGLASDDPIAPLTALSGPSVCDPPIVVAEGGRYIAITPRPPGGATPIALRVTSPQYAGIDHHVQTDGTLGCGAVFHVPDAWGAGGTPPTPGVVHLHDEFVVPSTASASTQYTVQADCGGGVVSSPVTVTTWKWGDANNSNVVNLDDILCILNGFASVFNQCTRYGDDLQGAEPNNAINLDDILAVLAAFAGANYPGPLPPTYPVVPAPVLNALTTMTNQSSVPISGTSTGAISVEWSSHTGVFQTPVNAMTGAFTANVTLAANRVNPVYFTAIDACGVRSAPSATSITHDGESPNLFIDFPADGASVTLNETDVAGRVGDMLSGFMGLTVKVNCPACPPQGIDAIVDVGIGNNGTFNASNVPLNLGANTITATATDALGNQTTKQITITRVDIPPNTPQMMVVSGNGQSAAVHEFLTNPITVKVLKADGSPFVNKVVTFHVTRSDGRLVGEMAANCYGDGSMMLQCHTDMNGEVRAMWKLGSDAGCGNNRVEVTSTSIAGTVAFCASAAPGPAAQINIGSGNNSRVETGAPAPEPLRAWVSDSCNGIPGVMVAYTVIQGGGKVKDPSGSTWLDSVTVPTTDTGHAAVNFMAGPDKGNQLVEANFTGNLTNPATFVIYALERDEAQPTSFSGLLFDNALQPIGGAECKLVVAGRPPLITTTTSQGQFSFPNVDGSGASDLFVDGAVATTLNAQSIPTGSFPFLHYTPVLVPNAANALPAPVSLPPLDPCNRVDYDGSQDVTLTVRMRDPATPTCDPATPGCCIPAIEGLEMLVQAGTTVRRSDGKCVGPDATCSGPDDLGQITLSLNQVHHDDVPMPMPDGTAPPYAGTLQPARAHFEPPIQITLPNVSELPAGTATTFVSFDHDAGRFEIVATGTVSSNGSTISTDLGSGISIAGWHSPFPPPPPTTVADGWVRVNAADLAKKAKQVAQILHPIIEAWSQAADSGLSAAYNDFLNALNGVNTITSFEGYLFNTLEAINKWLTARNDLEIFVASLTLADRLKTQLMIPVPPIYSTGVLALWLYDNHPNLGADSVARINTLQGFLDNARLRQDCGGPGGGLVSDESELGTEDEFALGPVQVSVRGMSSTTDVGGGFKVFNVPATVSLIRARMRTLVPEDETWFSTSVYLAPVSTGETEFMPMLASADVSLQPLPPALVYSDVASLRIDAHTSVINPNQSTQLIVTAQMANGNTIDMSAGSLGTSYRTSNTDVATVSIEGLVMGQGPGTAFITAVNEGAAAVKRIDVAAMTVMTTVEVFVQLQDGSAVPGASVTVTPCTNSDKTDTSGLFSLSVTCASTTITVFAQATINGQTYSGTASQLPTVFGGITDAGIIHVAPSCTPSWSPVFATGGMNGTVAALTVFDDGMGPTCCAGGGFTGAGGVPANLIAKWNGFSWSPLGSGMNSTVFALTVFDDGTGLTLYAGGSFTSAGGASADFIAKWNGTTWSPLGIGMDHWVSALTVFDDGTRPALYAGGSFASAGGASANFTAKWDGTAWSPLGSGMDNAVYSLAVFDDGTGPGLYAGGSFTNAGGGATANRVAKWNGTAWSPLGSGMQSSVYALTVFDDGTGPALYAGGSFASAGGASANFIAKWDGTTWTSLESGMDNAVYSLAVFDDGTGPGLYAGGSFTNAGGATANRVAKWNGTAWSPLGSGLNYSVYALTVFDDGTGPGLYVGGDFSTAGDVPSSYIARWGCQD